MEKNTLSDGLAKKFINALGTLESGGDAGPIAAMFGDGCELCNSISPHVFRGAEGARQFWSSYRSSFKQVKSEFRQVSATSEMATLEWTSKGRLVAGGEFEYDGVTLLSFDGERVSRFRSYFNPAPLTETVKAAESNGQTIPAEAVTDTSYASPGRTV